MKSAFPLLALLLFACGNGEGPVTQTVDTRAPIAVQYVGASRLDLHRSADGSSEVIATYQNGEAVSVLARNGEWSEVRTGDRSGWARSSDLVDATAAQAEEDNPTIRFRQAPMPVAANGARGEVYLEANVNTDGNVTDVKVLMNTTGSQQLLDRNVAALRQAQFEPIVKKGERKSFKYYHRATY